MFTPEEDAKIKELVQVFGEDWRAISKAMPDRTLRQVRERYKNFLAPGIVNGPWSRQEDSLLIQLFRSLGPKWSKISKHFPSRSDINVKNRWTSISKLADVNAYGNGGNKPPTGFPGPVDTDFGDETAIFSTPTREVLCAASPLFPTSWENDVWF